MQSLITCFCFAGKLINYNANINSYDFSIYTSYHRTANINGRLLLSFIIIVLICDLELLVLIVFKDLFCCFIF